MRDDDCRSLVRRLTQYMQHANEVRCTGSHTDAANFRLSSFQCMHPVRSRSFAGTSDKPVVRSGDVSPGDEPAASRTGSGDAAVVIALADDETSLLTAVKEMMRSDAHWIIVSNHADFGGTPHRIARVSNGGEVSPDNGDREAQPAQAVALPEERLAQAWDRFLSTGHSALDVSIVGHGETVDVDDPARTRRRVQGIDAAVLAAFARDWLGPMLASCAVIRFDFVTCSLTLPGESIDDPRSYIGEFLRRLHETGTPLHPASVITATAMHVNVGFPDAMLDRRMEVSIGMRTFTLDHAELAELGVAYQAIARLAGDRVTPASPLALPLTALEVALLKIYLDTRDNWNAWNTETFPGRFKIFDLISGLHLTVRDPSDIALICGFAESLMLLTTVSLPRANHARSEGPFRSPSGAPSCALSGSGSVANHRRNHPGGGRPRRHISLDYGVVRLHEGMETTPVTYDIQRPLGHLAMVLLKTTWCEEAMLALDADAQERLRAYFLTPVHRVDTHIFRWIGSPATGSEFIDRWLNRWTRDTAVDGPPAVPLGYIDGDTLHALFALVDDDETGDDVREIDRLLQASARRWLHSASSPIDVSSCRDAFYAGEGGVHPGETGGWLVHWPAVDDAECIPMEAPEAFEHCLGRVGAYVSSIVADKTRQIDEIHLGLLRGAYAHAIKEQNAAQVADKPARDGVNGVAADLTHRVAHEVTHDGAGSLMRHVSDRIGQAALPDTVDSLDSTVSTGGTNARSTSPHVAHPSYPPRAPDARVRRRIAGYWQMADPRLASERACVRR